MVSISVEDKTLHLYRGHFLWDNHSSVPSSFIAMGSRSSRRRSKGSRRTSSYLPVVVLNGQQPLLESRSDTKTQVQTYKKPTSWPGKFSIHDLTFGLLGSSSSSDPMRSSSSLSGSYSGGGCEYSSGGCNSGGNLNTLLFLAALAAAVLFLNQAITMNIGKKKRRFSGGSDSSEDIYEGLLSFQRKWYFLCFVF